MRSQGEKITMTIKEINRVGVIKRMQEKKLTAKAAGVIMGISGRQAKRLLRRFRKEGEQGLIGKWRGSGTAYTEVFKQGVLLIVGSVQYNGFRPTFASEKLRERHGLKVNRETLRQWMGEAGLWEGKKRKKIVTHQSRARRSRAGELVQIDGSHHDWFEGRAPRCCLLVFIDDATSQITNLRFEEAETTLGYFRCVKDYILKRGCPVSFYSDKYGVFSVNVADKVSGLYGTTQFQRAMKELKIEMILANSPQAKGRVERANKTLQDRLIKEMRLDGINSMDQANAWTPGFIKAHNDKLAIAALDSADGHRALDISHARLDMVLSNQATRKLSKNLEVQYNNTIYQVKRTGISYGLRHAAVTVCERTDGKITIHRGEEVLKYETISKALYKVEIADRKEVNALLDRKLIERLMLKHLLTENAMAVAA
jgi:hypothetical protein